MMTLELPNLNDINLSTISLLEGGPHLSAYVPTKHGEPIDASGVTIATGVDLGQRNWLELVRLGLPEPLVEKLKPYCLFKGKAALALLATKPLTISGDEAKILDRAVWTSIIKRLISNYEKDARFLFHLLPPAAQTVLASLAINRGADFGYLTETNTRWWRSWNDAWKLATAQSWLELRELLQDENNWSSALRKRRFREGELLKGIV